MLKIKLSRKGKKKYPIYRIIISEVARDPYGRSLEILGFYNPHTKELNVKADRVKHWLDQGAQMTDTVNNLLVGQKIVEGKKVAVSKLTKKSREAIAKKVADEKAKEEKAKADAEATKQAEAQAETPVVEPVAEATVVEPVAETVPEEAQA